MDTAEEECIRVFRTDGSASHDRVPRRVPPRSSPSRMVDMASGDGPNDNDKDQALAEHDRRKAAASRQAKRS